MPWAIQHKHRGGALYLKSHHAAEWTRNGTEAAAFWDEDDATATAIRLRRETGRACRLMDYAEAALPGFISDAYKAQVSEQDRRPGAVVTLEWWAPSLPDFNRLPGMTVRVGEFEESGRGFAIKATVQLADVGGRRR